MTAPTRGQLEILGSENTIPALTGVAQLFGCCP